MKQMTFEDAINKKAIGVANTVVGKQKDYGKNNILLCPAGPELGIVVRLFDKLNRLANLYQQGKPPTNESLRDTWIDIAGYGLIGIMLADDEFKLPMKE